MKRRSGAGSGVHRVQEHPSPTPEMTWVTAYDNVFSFSCVVFAGIKRHLQPLDAFWGS